MKDDEAKQRRKNDDDPILRVLLCIPASAADAAAVNPKGIKTLLANGLVTFFINGNPLLVMDQKVCQEFLLIASS